MPDEVDYTLHEVARSQMRLDRSMEAINRKLEVFTEAGIVRRLDEVEERLRWYGRWLLGLLGLLVVSGAITYLAAVSR